jgi:hypothetical protein
MGKRIIITENQYNNLKNKLFESSLQSNIVKQIKEYLDANYTAETNYVLEGGEYKSKKMFKLNVNNEVISPKALFEHLINKFNMSEEFTKQVMRDWYHNKIGEDYILSKSVSLK